MVQQISNGIRIVVSTSFVGFSQNNYIFTYAIIIENLNEETIKLMSRRWLITEGDGTLREVKGQGVVGNQPIIKQGQKFQYESYTSYECEIGKMQGTYFMVIEGETDTFSVEIPEFTLVAPSRLN